MAKKKSVLTDEVSALIEKLLAALPESESTSSPASFTQTKSRTRRPQGRTRLSRNDVALMRAYTSRKLKSFSEDAEPLGTKVQFTKANPITIWDPRTGRQAEVVYPPLNDLIDYYRERYPNQIQFHFIGKRVLTNLLNVPGVTAVKIIQGIIPDFEQTARNAGQKLVLKAIYRLQRLLKEVEPRQLIFVGVDAAGNELLQVAVQSQPMSDSPQLVGLHGTEHSMQAGSMQSFPPVIPPIVMGEERGDAVDIVVHHP